MGFEDSPNVIFGYNLGNDVDGSFYIRKKELDYMQGWSRGVGFRVRSSLERFMNLSG